MSKLRPTALTITVLAAFGLVVAGCSLIPTPAPPKAPPLPSVQQRPSVKSDNPTPLPPPRPTLARTQIVLSGDGIGDFAFGAPRAAVSAYLTKALGRPKLHPDWDGLGQCEGGYGLWGVTETYGDLDVRYYADDGSPTSPQKLASWTLHRDTQPDPPLALAKGIPTGLTMDQLRARYPDGGDLEDLGVWMVGSVFIGPAGDGDPGMMFAGLLDWCI